MRNSTKLSPCSYETFEGMSHKQQTFRYWCWYRLRFGFYIRFLDPNRNLYQQITIRIEESNTIVSTKNKPKVFFDSKFKRCQKFPCNSVHNIVAFW